jgi:gliding motility-associated-like protein
MKMHNLKDLVENVQEMPTGHCWESIEQQLSVMMPSSPAGQGAASGQQAASGIKGSLLQKSAAFWVKAAAITVSSIAVTTVAVVTIVNISKNNPTPTSVSQPLPSENIATIADNDSLLTVTEENSGTNFQSEKKINGNGKSAVVENKVIPVQNTQNINQNLQTVNLSTNKQVSVKSAFETKPSIAPQPNSSVKPTTPTQTTIPQNLTNDPVIQNMDKEEQLDFSSPIILEIPNVITPNGDGYNETFVISGIEQCDKSRLIIRNKSGKIVFQTLQYENNWGADGLEAGIYYYQFYYTIHNIQETRSGTLTVIK